MINNIAFPGSFDPLTFGHIDIINKLIKMSKTITIILANNNNKFPFVSIDIRKKILSEFFSNNMNIQVVTLNKYELLVNFLKENSIFLIARGIRNYIDFEYEMQMSIVNNHLNNLVETIFLCPREENRCISSSLVRELLKFHGNIKKYVPIEIIKYYF
jgi:pantetheine-phosphate adenylyltransferase